MAHKETAEFIPLNIAVLTVSDTRTEADDTSGKLLADSLQTAGHKLGEKVICIDDVYKIRAVVSQWIASDDIQVVLVTGGTGFYDRDMTPESLEPLFDRTVHGYGELFRQISYEQIGTSTIQSRAIAGVANGTLIMAMPGSNNACRTAWDMIIKDQLDSRTRPCNFAGRLKGVEID